MVVGEVAERADVVVVGAGPGGYVAALRCAAAGRSVIVIERDRVGGTCLNVGCIPSKTLIHAASAVGAARRDAIPGVQIDTAVDAAAMRDHRDAVVATLTNGVSALLADAGVELWHGEASFSRANRLAITSGDQVRHLEFGDVIVATGSTPVDLPKLPFDGQRVLDSTAALALDRVPASVAVVGGGYIGLELGTALANLGSQVSIIEAADHLLPAIDRIAGSAIARRLRSMGVSVLTNTVAHELTGSGLAVRPSQSGANAGSGTEIEAEVVIVAVGRRPVTDQIGLDRAGVVVTASGHIDVDGQGRAGPGVWAIGDVVAGPALAHKATSEAEVVADALTGGHRRLDHRTIPEVVFCDPEVVRVGASAADEIAAGRHVDVATFHHVAGSRSRTVNDTSGFVQLVGDEQGTVIGALAVGPHVAELAGELSMIVELCVTADELTHIVHAHPTMSEGIVEAAHQLSGRPLHGR